MHEYGPSGRPIFTATSSWDSIPDRRPVGTWNDRERRGGGGYRAGLADVDGKDVAAISDELAGLPVVLPG
jgi:hypothetical protein